MSILLFFCCLLSSVFIVPQGANDDFDSFEDEYIPSAEEANVEMNRMRWLINRAPPNQIPAGVGSTHYLPDDERLLVKLYQSTKTEDTKRLLQKIASDANIHKLYWLLANAVKRLRGRADTIVPTLHQNCVPCANAVDLILQSLYDYTVEGWQIRHYYANVSDLQTQRVAYAQHREILPWKEDELLSSVIQRSVQPNSRYLLGAEVRSRWFTKSYGHATNMVIDEKNHIWIIDGQKRRLYDFANPKDVRALNEAFGKGKVRDHSAKGIRHFERIYTGPFKPPEQLLSWQKRDQKEPDDSVSNLSIPVLENGLDYSLLNDALAE